MDQNAIVLSLLIEERQRRAEVEQALTRTQEALADAQAKNAELRERLAAPTQGE